MDYPLPEGVHAVPKDQLDLRSDSEVDQDLMNPKPITDEKNVFFFWHSGFSTMHGYTKRNIRAWHRRFSIQGWAIRVLDRVASSPLNVANFLDVHDPGTFPRAFVDGTIGGEYAPQHTSDLVRLPLLVKYGGVYADVGLMQIGDLDRLWSQTIGNADSPFEVLSYNMGGVDGRSLTNYFLASHKSNSLFERCHRLFLALFAADGGKASTDGMHTDPLLKGTPLLMSGNSMSFEDNGKKYGPMKSAECFLTTSFKDRSLQWLWDSLTTKMAGMDQSTSQSMSTPSTTWQVRSSSTSSRIGMVTRHLS